MYIFTLLYMFLLMTCFKTLKSTLHPVFLLSGVVRRRWGARWTRCGFVTHGDIQARSQSTRMGSVSN